MVALVVLLGAEEVAVPVLPGAVEEAVLVGGRQGRGKARHRQRATTRRPPIGGTFVRQTAHRSVGSGTGA